MISLTLTKKVAASFPIDLQNITINKSVVISECQIHHRSGDNLITYTNGSIDNIMHSQNGGLGWIENGSSHHTSEHSSIGNGESSSTHILQSDLA